LQIVKSFSYYFLEFIKSQKYKIIGFLRFSNVNYFRGNEKAPHLPRFVNKTFEVTFAPIPQL